MRRTGGADYINCNQTSIDRLPSNDVRDGAYGRSGAPPTVAELALLNAIKPRLLELLNGNGVSLAWITEKTGVGRRQISQYLEAMGAKRHTGIYRLPSPLRLRNFDRYF